MTTYADYWRAVASQDDAAALDAARAGVQEKNLEHVLDAWVVRAQHQVGALWADNEWSVAQEHAATAVGEYVVRSLLHDVATPPGPLHLVACADREWHALPALVLSAGLQARGVHTEFLGPSVSAEHLLNRVLDTGAKAVLLSASLSSSLVRVRRQIEAVQGTGTPVIVGGTAFGEKGRWAPSLGAAAYGASMDDAFEALQKIPRQASPPKPLTHRGAEEARLVSARTPLIARVVVERLFSELNESAVEGRSQDAWPTVLMTHAHHVVDCLAASLLVDDPVLMAREKTWLNVVLTGRGAPAGLADRLWVLLADELRDHPEALRILAVEAPETV